MKNSPLIPVLSGTLNGQAAQLVDARRLHEFLGVGRDFTTWVKERIAEFSFIEGEDFITVSVPPIRGTGNRGRRADYFLCLDMAKELAMVERTARGREARRYFIDCERQLRQLRQAMTTSRPSGRTGHVEPGPEAGHQPAGMGRCCRSGLRRFPCPARGTVAGTCPGG